MSQGAVGATAALLVAGRERMPAAAILGGLSAMAADLDVLIRSSSDPLLFLEYHRQVTHSLLFVPVGALVCAAVAWPVARRILAFRSVFLYCLVGYATHGLLDGCTSYGTQLLWPFSDRRIAWNLVSVVDPLFTLPLLAGVGGAAIRRSPGLARASLVWVVLYLGVGWAQHARAQAFGRAMARDRGHLAVAVEAKPAFGNLLLWKTFYRHGERYFVDAARMGFEPHGYVGQSTPRLDVAGDLPWLDPGSVQARDIERFRWFSDGYVALDPADPGRIIDVRYSMVPNRIEALWGLRLDPGAPAATHAEFFASREPTPEQRAALVGMLLGRPKPSARDPQ